MRRMGVVGDPEWTHHSDSHVPRAKLSVSSLQSCSMSAMRASLGVQGEVDRRGTVLATCLAPHRHVYAGSSPCTTLRICLST